MPQLLVTLWGRVPDVVKTFVLKWANDWSMNLASMIAYNLITAIFPILLAVLSIVGMALAAFASTHITDVARAINAVFPPTQEGRVDVTPLLKSLIQITGPLAVAALVTLLWLGSNLFANIENAFSIIFRIRGRDLIAQRIMAIGMVLVLAILLPISLGAASFVTAGSADIARHLPPRLGAVLSYVGPLTSLGVLWLLFLVIYIVVPNFEVRFRQAWRGALTAAILFGLLQLLFPTYLKFFLTGNSRYGGLAATILVVIIWLWIFALITVIGAQLNAVAMGLKASPYDLARTFEMAYEQHDVLVGTKRKTTATRLKRLRALLGRHGRPKAGRIASRERVRRRPGGDSRP